MGADRDNPAEGLRRDDRRHLLHPLSRFEELDAGRGLVLAEADGIRVRTVEGDEYVDAFSGLMNVNVGYGRHQLAEAAAAQLAELAYTPLFFARSNPPAIRLARRLAELLEAPGLTTWHFTSGGSEANETAVKLARLYFDTIGKPGKRHIISREGSYHGVTYGALGATALPAYHAGFGPIPGGFSHVDAGSAAALEAEILAQGARNVAAILIDPISLPGGLRPPPESYWRELDAIRERHDVLLILDEVVSGFGRTGRMFGLEHWDVRPDLITLAKGITSGYAPLGAVGLRREIAEAVERLPMFMHGVTAGGHPASCAVALRNIELIEAEGLAAAAADAGAELMRLLEPLMQLEPVKDVRGLGLLLAIEFAGEPGVADLTQKLLFARGVLARSYGDFLVVGPPLVVARADLELIATAVSSAVEQACTSRVSA